MTSTMPKLIHSDLSRRVTLDGISVEVRIYRLMHHRQWMLEVANEWGSSAIWEELFATDIAALGAFQAMVQEEGMATFVGRSDTETLH